MKQIITLVITISIIILAYTQKEGMLHLIESGESTAIIISLLFVALLVFFPVTPFAIVAGIIGSVFGVWTGSIISLCGSVFGSLIMFFVARYGFQQWVQKVLNKYPKAKEYESIFQKNAFIGILLFRIAPVIPAPLLNVLCGVSMIRWPIFFIATLIGKFPSIVIFTFAGSLFASNKLLSVIIYGTYFVIIAIITTIHIQKRKIQM
ncbi:TVP38/TMEM64 family protein [Bacillus sporothermodurans]|uniref:TVP38/TMEM64 family protein n=1 Tax=Heyndrickxia sporothermodurans TaxID=46224 RepID=UPI00192C8A92|nr:TVP38/TMEM64 family protein [Heyndrickxia sporothermodurans]MBL5801323.1 TVP38/TMEM64 family protein [Heyndrickxia sporothermodurans]MBL5812392.1 TVP38/TMEM64 family protein [Heyndrickxia sporothermodurans]MBL5815865.1 TVP38/TMEM64 family protein [Heyndrickxia sporothermodurans]MBL5819295.1 TVP38/TMEM64 family protein [Heyndrickxia sporothermodurans]MBL5844412.1 TVP38/TMEM64 family protein [Heyndrickxia sporothermodurans]